MFSKDFGIEQYDSSQYLELLDQIEKRCPVSHVVAGGLGIAGLIGRQIRETHDLDLIIDQANKEEMQIYLKEGGYRRLDQDEEDKLLKGGGMVFTNNEGLRIDVVSGIFSDEGLNLQFAEGNLFIPRIGLGVEAVLDDISFLTFSPEVFYFLKNRATRRLPWQTISLFNRKQDKTDYLVLKKIIDPQRAQELLEAGFSYTGRHPGITQLKQLFFSMFPNRTE
ncbi:MAG: hypothetical protein WAV40_04370 [Microgenomates group bacterium]